MDIIAERQFGIGYIILDSIFILVFLFLLFFTKRKLTFLWAIAGGVLYFLIDYGIFHLATGSRHIEMIETSGGTIAGTEWLMFWVLLWMSLSYGITNFAWIWLCLKKDKHIVEWTLLIFIWWIVCPILDDAIGGTQIHIWRETGDYHWFMAVFLLVSYLAVIVYNLLQKEKFKRMKIWWLFIIGVAVQFGWEFTLLIGGIRSASMDITEQLQTLITNSLIETNLGLPAIYCIYLLVTSRVDEDLKQREKISFLDRLIESNLDTYRSLETKKD